MQFGRSKDLTAAGREAADLRFFTAYISIRGLGFKIGTRAKKFFGPEIGSCGFGSIACRKGICVAPPGDLLSQTAFYSWSINGVTLTQVRIRF